MKKSGDDFKKKFNTLKYNCRSDDATSNIDTKVRIQSVLDLIGRGRKVLDIGCYDGYISEKIKENGNDVIGIDISKEGARLCNERGIKCIEQDIEKKFPFPADSFDVVFGGEIIEHVFDTDALLQEIQRVLKPGGFLVLTTPNIASLTKRIHFLFGNTPSIEIGLISPDGKEKGAGHIRYFTINSLEKLLNRNGFFIEIWKTDFITLHKLKLVTLGRMLPSFGYELIVKAKVEKTSDK
ncbi:Ubiquinone biosynthesis O-methyltransferase [uncultured archaeon]|nr:Ubiquinone biosynthesis O-methyltransferase [uncultured archaeon]